MVAWIGEINSGRGLRMNVVVPDVVVSYTAATGFCMHGNGMRAHQPARTRDWSTYMFVAVIDWHFIWLGESNHA